MVCLIAAGAAVGGSASKPCTALNGAVGLCQPHAMGASTAVGHYVVHIWKADRWVIYSNKKVR